MDLHSLTQAYVNAFDACDLDKTIEFFSEEFVLEDPVHNTYTQTHHNMLDELKIFEFRQAALWDVRTRRMLFKNCFRLMKAKSISKPSTS